jgi:hypothetical protein
MEIWERAKVEGKGKSVGRKGKNINGSRHNRETAIPFITPQGGFGKKKKKTYTECTVLFDTTFEFSPLLGTQPTRGPDKPVKY